MRKVLGLLLVLALVLPTAALAGVTDPLANPPGTIPVAKEPVELSIAVSQSEFVTDYEDNFQTRLYEEISGTKIKFDLFPSVDATQKIKLMVTSGSVLPDIIPNNFVGNDADRYLYGEAGAIIPLNDYFDRENGIADAFYAACEKVDLDPDWVLNMARSPDGNIYAMPNYPLAYANIYSNRAWINQDWLDALGLAHPTNIDELTEVLIAFRDGDPNGNGEADEIPMSGASSGTNSLGSNAYPLNWIQNMFIYSDMSQDRYLPLSQTGGVVDVSYDKPEYREFLKYVNMLVEEKLLSELCFTQSVSEMRAQLQADTATIGMMFGSANGFADKIAAWQPMEQPAGIDGERIVTTRFADFGVNWAISADCEHPEIAFLFGCLGYQDTQYPLTARFGELGVDWVYADETQPSVFQEMGMAPNIQVLNITWATPNNKSWQGLNLPCIYAPNTSVEIFDGNELYGERLHGRSVSMNYEYGPDMSDIVTKIVYTNDEQDRWGEIRNSLQVYVQEAMALFAIGQLDPSSDTDWNNYLAELEKLQYQELLEVDNVAYRRTNGLD